MNLPFLRFSLLLTIVLILAVAAPLSRGQEVESGYGPLPVFEFHSGFWVNLHQFLYHEARLRESTPESKAAAANTAEPALKQNPVSLSAAEQKTWEQAIAYYRANYAGKDPQINIDLILLNNQRGDFEDCDELLGRKKKACDAGLPGNIGVILEAAAPVYRSHWWANHDRANRRWVARVAPLIREQGVGLSQRLAGIYQPPGPKANIRVEVCAFATSPGALTTPQPRTVATPIPGHSD